MHIDDNDKDVCIKARLLWIASDTVRGLHFLRLYFSEWQPPEPFKEQEQAFKQAQQDDPFEANQFLISVSLLNVDMDDPKPRGGSDDHTIQTQCLPQLLSNPFQTLRAH
ncbi:hypothetical protein PPTG_19930 [Phytophthora nicotianae INRA-310]|uniref:Uncharacterized protein n=1 Tax=Phytophthora nicotianae (strain INRA-310) TaxID=761204 RepID=W2PBC5_PHYN3|nr:hypothetical protein PPTG_19930 [Phytophthora nicotianae INRA-310]ETM97970.1 hypothetical protein PPTG_19930 [Phytophthora nicotianae INRA-310]